MDTTQNNSFEQKIVEQEYNLITCILDICKAWKKIALFTFLGASLSVLAALSTTKIYRVSIQAGLPSDSSVELYNVDTQVPLTKKELFILYLERLNAPDNFRTFLEQQNRFASIFPDSNASTEVMFANIILGYEYEILVPVSNEQDAALQEPNIIVLSLQCELEKVCAEILNGYAIDTGEKLLLDLSQQSEFIRARTLEKLQQRVLLLRENAKAKRLMEIAILEEENKNKIAVLDQRMSLIIAKAKNDRLVNISNIEQQNHLKLKNLEQKYDLLIQKSKRDRKTQILEAKEALQIANALGVEFPTTVNDFNEKSESAAATNINLINNQDIPLYLMGSEYLKALIKSLEQRKEDQLYVTESSSILMEIEQVKNDQALVQLKQRENDAELILALNELKNQKQAIIDDKELAALKSRKSDDLYSVELPAVLEEIRELEALSFTFENVTPYELQAKAIMSGRPYKSNRFAIAAVGTIGFGLIGVLWVLFFAAVERRNVAG